MRSLGLVGGDRIELLQLGLALAGWGWDVPSDFDDGA